MDGPRGPIESNRVVQKGLADVSGKRRRSGPGVPKHDGSLDGFDRKTGGIHSVKIILDFQSRYIF